jgi:malic enzyme
MPGKPLQRLGLVYKYDAYRGLTELNITLWHDGQQGPAAVALAGLMNALKLVGKPKQAVKIPMIGAGAANLAVSRVLIAAGFPAEQLVMVDTKGLLHQGRDDLHTPADGAFLDFDIRRENSPHFLFA